MNRHGIRFRISMAFLIIGAALSSVFAIAVWYLSEAMEQRYIEATLVENLAMVIDDRRANGQARLPYSKTIKGYALKKDGGDPAPDFFGALVPGIHERSEGGTTLQIAVRDDGDTRYVLTYDETALERFETELTVGLILGVAVFSYIALWLGFWASGRVVEPVTLLARKVRALGDRTDNVTLEGDWGDDEVGELARAFERYSKRLSGFIEREAAFTADVSHELRNPVMSASSTVELLLTRRDLHPSLHPQLLRLQRAITRMGELVDVFLSLARETSAPDRTEVATADIEGLIKDALELYAPLMDRKGLSVDLQVRKRIMVTDRAAASIVLDNLIGNAVHHTLSGRISVEIDERSVTITDSGPGIPSAETPRIFDRTFRGQSAAPGGAGLGLSIVRRLCERAGWRVEILNKDGGGTIARAVFSPPRNASPDFPSTGISPP